jgi:hypothetical protein
MTKYCSSCRLAKPVDGFAKNRSTHDGLQHHRRDCQADAYRRKREAIGKSVRAKIEIPPGKKFCPGCSQIKPMSDWNANRAARDGWASYCKSCSAQRGRIGYLARKYSLSPDEVEALFAAQPVCPICLKNKPAHIDHDHETGRIRGVPCFTCNAAIGQLRDDPVIMRRAAAYVEGDVWQPITLGPGAYRLPFSPPAARLSPTSSASTRPSSSLDVARLRPPPLPPRRRTAPRSSP